LQVKDKGSRIKGKEKVAGIIELIAAAKAKK